MHQEPPHGDVLVLAEDSDSGDRLGRWIASVGERPLVARNDGKSLSGVRDDDPVDLVVTDLRTAEIPSRTLLQRFLSGELFPQAPRLHLHRTEDERLEIAEGGPEATALAMAYPSDPSEFLMRVRLAAEVGRLRRELARIQTRDLMTGLSSRPYLLRRLEEEFARAHRHRTPVSLVLFDVDRLSAVNETFGFSTGDSILQRFAEIVRLQVRREDVCGRLDGATIAVVLPANGYRGAATFAHKVRTDAEEILIEHGDAVYQVHISAGISTYPDNAVVTGSEKLLAAAQGALAEAKARGGNRVFIDEAVLRHERRVVLVADPDPELLDLAEDLLAVDDYQVVRAESPRALLETLRFRKPDLLVIDVQMRERRGGPPLIEQVQAMFPEGSFPVIGLSSDAGTSPDRLNRLGVDRFITKPFSVSILRAAARELLEGSRAT
jgi:diguanylate cyclase (GGDEF)-like protein